MAETKPKATEAKKTVAKKKSTKKAPPKKKTDSKKPAKPKKQETGLVVPMKDDGTPLTLIPTPMQQKQVLHVLQKTPSQHVYERTAKGGGKWKYVTGAYVKKVLNYTFGWLWNFEIVDKGKEGSLVWVQGKLTILDPETRQPMIVKEQFGRAEIKFKRGTQTPLDYGNDLKAAATDALKKCASELGIASDIYAGNEFKDIRKQDNKFDPPPVEEVVIDGGVVEKSGPLPAKPSDAYECHGCGEVIDKAVHDYSKRVHKKPLCRGCQQAQ